MVRVCVHFVTAAQSIFANCLLRTLADINPNIDAAKVLATGASEIRQVFGGDELAAVLDAYMIGIKDIFVFALAGAAFTVLISLAIPCMKLPSHNTAKVEVDLVINASLTDYVPRSYLHSTSHRCILGVGVGLSPSLLHSSAGCAPPFLVVATSTSPRVLLLVTRLRIVVGLHRDTLARRLPKGSSTLLPSPLAASSILPAIYPMPSSCPAARMGVPTSMRVRGGEVASTDTRPCLLRYWIAPPRTRACGTGGCPRGQGSLTSEVGRWR
ncbi:hypothetical protein C8R44DRAFT_978083 [Mycena epipterygia]|nr:hypothetical protein C8R44DRAFT_978083 [Mycena epipterygia]